ncbi:enolase C-terminal domain-like protein [Allorhodopirellula heiligendammensis]|uniref:enolase C-terminal domain-like protein n=1 Tax=Allorhodopirellula heiligendammensis TaxID=2714739 RepID=UPI00265F0C75|nr:enolase C-terminal domain-like protein [Allorhodopirellula heiligendammensis]
MSIQDRVTAPTALVDVSFQLATESYRYRTPMKFGGRVVNDVTVLNATCDATLASGQRGRGLGSMTMGVAWAWPDPSIEDAKKLAVVLEIAERLAAACHEIDGAGHPVEICLNLAQRRSQIAVEVAQRQSLTTPIPELAVLLAGSVIEAALFDAQGKAAAMSSYALLTSEHLPHDLGELLGDPDYKGLTLDQFVSAQPIATLPLYHLVGALDPLTQDEVKQPVGDGLPESLGEWIERNELTHLKIKLAGDDAVWDLQRVIGIHQVACQTQQRGSSTGKPYFYSLDFNERCPDEEYVLKLLADLQQQSPDGYERVQYIEQPTARDLTRPDAVTMHRVGKLKPVVIDESLTDLNSLRLAVAQGYSGIALKACKGHAEALLLGAVAQHEGLFLCVQDLTCVGASFLHSASLAAHIPAVAAVESNGRQYSPAGNAAWMKRYPEMFEIRGGEIPTRVLDGPGLGYAL